MKTWSYFNPVHVYFGENSLERLPGVLAGRKALVLTYPEASYTDLLHRLEKLTGKHLAGLIDGVPPLPEISDLRDLYESVHRHFSAAEVIVAVGGGSVLDTGKILATVSPEMTFSGIVDAIERKDTRSLSAIPFIAVPTTAGTGSEVTPWATLWDRNSEQKYSLHHSAIFPEAALVDPLLTRTLPPGPTLASGLDALSHALEAIWNRNANPISDALAVKAASEVFRSLPELMREPGRGHLRSRMSLAALLAGLAFSNTQTALAHSISYPMTLRHNLPHGIACSFCLPFVMSKAIGSDPGCDEVLMRVFGDDLDRAPGILRGFPEKLGVSTGFAEYAVGEEEAQEIVHLACSGPRGRNFITRN
jgi:phosphonate metabolism-associated iron-containing alcohol dehydrogenase